MSGRQRRFDWIDERNGIQIEWALSYLRKANVPLSDRMDPIQQFQQFRREWLRPAPSPDEEVDRERLVKRMQKAWEKVEERRLKVGVKAYSYEMSKAVGPALQRLKNDTNQPIYKVLEALILNTDDFRKHLEEQKKDEIARIKPPKGGNTDRIAQRREEQLKAQQRLVQAWEEAVDSLLSQGARYWVTLDANGLLDEKRKLVPLGPDQERKAAALHQRWKADLTKSIKARASQADFMTGALPPLEQKN